MKRVLLLTLCAVLILSAGLAAQERPQQQNEQRSAAGSQAKQEPQQKARDLVPYKLQVVFNEFEGEKRVSSLPYTLTINAGGGERGSVRMGLKVPIVTAPAKEGQVSQIQYLDVGTNIDAYPYPDGSRINVTFERTSLYFAEGEQRMDTPRPLTVGANPVMRQFRGNVELIFRDGASTQATVATDPVSGRVLKVEVTLQMVK